MRITEPVAGTVACMSSRLGPAVGALVAALLLPACASAQTPPPPVDREPGTAAPRQASGTQVLAISVDGLNTEAIRKLGRAGAPTFWRMMTEGARTLNARTEYEQNVTLPNHTSMLTSRRIDRQKSGHGVTWDDDRPGTTVQAAAGHPVGSVFSVLHGSGGSTISSGLSLQPGHSHVVRVPSLRHGIHPALRAASRAARSPGQLNARSAVGAVTRWRGRTSVPGT